MFDHVGFSLLYRAVSFRDLFNAELRRIGDFDYLLNEGLGRHFARAYRSENSLTSLCEAAGRAYRDQGGR